MGSDYVVIRWEPFERRNVLDVCFVSRFDGCNALLNSRGMSGELRVGDVGIKLLESHTSVY